jgi:hypothetical protein
MSDQPKKIIIISYFFTPCSLTAAQRPKAWVNYLMKYGYKPIIITRNWDITINHPKDQLISTGTEVIHEIHENYEVYYLPYKATLRDNLFNSKFKFIRFWSKFFTIVHLFLENFSNLFIPFSNLFSFSTEIIKKEDIKAVIITANPFIQFRFGYLINKKFNIPWIADYRDDWTTSEIEKKESILHKFILKIHKHFEFKWVKTASYVTSVSDVYTERISSFTKVKGEVILNGFNKFVDVDKVSEPTIFSITYNGTLYPTQDVETFLDVIIELIDEFSEKIKIHINFPGAKFDQIQANRILKKMKKYEGNFFISDRIDKNTVLEMQGKSDLLLMLTHTNVKGIPSSKLYEYISLKKPILTFPSDNDIVEQTLNYIGNGIICNDKIELKQKLVELINKKIDSEPLIDFIDDSKYLHFSVEKQVKKLANLIDILLIK